MYQSFLHYANARYLWVALAITTISTLIYAEYDPGIPRNGGTWFGFTVGTIAALLIVWLTLLGVRKRTYNTDSLQVAGWLSAHVYLGTSLLILATLHSAGQLGWNIHSVAYLLMLVVIFSGFYGVYVYRFYPEKISLNRGGRSREMFLQELASTDRDCRSMATNALPHIQAAVYSALDRTALGSNSWGLLRGRDDSRVELPSANGSMRVEHNPAQARILDYLGSQLATSPGGSDAEVVQKLVNLFAQRKALIDVISRDIRMQWRLRFWLFIHVPLTFALWGALIAHIVSVFAYW